MFKLNTLKKTKTISLLIILTLISSCTSEENIITNEDQIALESLKPELISSIDFNTKTTYKTDNGDIVYYKIKNNDNSFLFKDYMGNFSVIDILNNDKFNYIGISKELKLSFEMNYNEKYKTKIVNLESTLNNQISNQLLKKSSSSCSTRYGIDLGMCLISVAGIAASDGPLPFADVLAISYGVACGVRAADSYGDCLNNQ
jgi:hypothetical protein|tara:strand:+ start:228 stop:830 length:603 start_codon:yes stop_codon:yes gene_type:complete